MGSHYDHLWQYDYSQLYGVTGNVNFDSDRACNDYYVVYHASVLFNFWTNGGICKEYLYRNYLQVIND